MLRMRKRVISMLLAGIVCAIAIPEGSAAASAQEEPTDPKEVLSTEEVMDLDGFVYEAVEKEAADSKEDTGYLEPGLEDEEGLSVQLVKEGESREGILMYGDYNYVVQEDGAVEISRYRGTEKDITVPECIDGKKVTSIDSSAFLDCHTLEHVIIPQYVIIIDYSAFHNCKNLVSVEFQGDVTELGSKVFQGCSSLTDITLPQSLTRIGSNAFQGCSSLTSIEIPQNVTSIGVNVFGHCGSLTEIKVDSSNEKYASQNGMLYNKDKTWLYCCPGGKTGKVEIPGSVRLLLVDEEWDCFQGCNKVTEIVVDDSNENYASQDGLVYNKKMTTLFRCPEGKAGNVTLPEGVAGVSVGAFYECTGIRNVAMPESVTGIGWKAFYGCSNLETADIPEKMERIQMEAFRKCSKLRSVNIPATVSQIGDMAFYLCDSLTGIHVDDGNENYASQDGMLYNKDMTKLLRCPGGKTGTATVAKNAVFKASAFYYCRNLERIVVDESNEEYTTEDGILYNKDMSMLLVCPGGRTGNVTIPGDVILGDFAFKYCSKLESITFPSDVFWTTPSTPSIFEECSKDTVWIVPYESWVRVYAELEGITHQYLPCTDQTHVFKETFTPATSQKNGGNSEKCQVCGAEINKTVIYAANTINLSETSYTYNKKEQKPSVTIKDSQGNVLKADADYTVSYPEDMKNVGSYAVTIKFQGNYTGTVTKNFTIVPQICAANTTNLSNTSYTYNKKIQKPFVTVKDNEGNVLKEGTDYIVSYPQGMKSVGNYIVTIKFQGNYAGTVAKSFTIAPKSTTIAKVAAKKKGFTVKWKKQADQTTGYEIAYSTDGKFGKKAAKAVTIGKNKTVSKTVSKLKAKKKYYVRIRTYKTVKVSGKSTKIYSSWSKAKTVTTKK